MDERSGLATLAWQTWFGLISRWLSTRIVVEAAIDWPLIAGNSEAFADVAVPGAELMDMVKVSTFPIHHDMSAIGAVTAPGMVTVWLKNHTGGTPIDLGPGRIRIIVEKLP